MRMFFKLIKLNLNISFGISAIRNSFRKKEKIGQTLLMLFVLLFCGVTFISIYTLLVNTLLEGAMSFSPPQPEVVLLIAFLVIMFMNLIAGIFYIIGAFYFNNDLNILIPLPLKPYQILAGKFAPCLAFEYLLALPFLLPPMIIYGKLTNQNFYYFIKSVFVLICAPALPMIIAAVIVVLLMRFVNFRKRKDTFLLIGGALGIGLILTTNIFIQNITANSTQNSITSFLSDKAHIISLIGSKFPPSIWATKALTSNGADGIINLLAFVFVSLFLFLFLLYIGNKFFLKSAIAGQETSKKKIK
jgi:ABC-2 type transport system permease protein